MSRRIPLSQGKFAIVDDEDYENVIKFPWHLDVKGNICYAKCRMTMGYIGKKEISARMYLHRYLMKPPTKKIIDHINGNGLDCRRSNMRICTHSENTQNRKHAVPRGTSSYIGVSWNARDSIWDACITYKYKTIRLGRSKIEAKAAILYDAKAIELFGKYAHTNFRITKKSSSSVCELSFEISLIKEP